MNTRTLGELAQALGQTCASPHLPITHITTDSRAVRAGALFVAYPGVHVDGHRFILQAIAAGAVAVVGEQNLHLPVPYLQTPNARRAWGLLCAAWEGHPSRKLGVIGVTGTDGKTTTSNFLASILQAAGLSSGLLTTVFARIGAQTQETGLHVTTPDAAALQKYLRQMVETGCEWAVLETTSHGLSQWRVAGVAYDIAVVTNVTHEHLDEHGDYAGYLAAKARLLELVAEGRPKTGIPRGAILNADDSSYDQLSRCDAPLALSYGIQRGDIRASEITEQGEGLRFQVTGRKRRPLPVQIPFRGRFNVYNSLAAIAVAHLLNVDDVSIQRGLAQTPAIPGRMERIERGQDFTAIVDFAHTPYALRAALQTARQLTRGQVIVVFGSAGLRDVAKRRLMGEIAGREADLAIITAEDPRTEDLEAIMAASARACQAVGGKAWVEPDRYRAIQLALSRAQPGDVVMVCGKGHEQSMCFGEIEYPWDDRVALRHALDVHLGRTDTPPPFQLPTAKPAPPREGLE